MICMYVCMYVCVYIYIYTHVCIYIYIYIRTYTYMCIYIYIHCFVIIIIIIVITNSIVIMCVIVHWKATWHKREQDEASKTKQHYEGVEQLQWPKDKRSAHLCVNTCCALMVLSLSPTTRWSQTYWIVLCNGYGTIPQRSTLIQWYLIQ